MVVCLPSVVSTVVGCLNVPLITSAWVEMVATRSLFTSCLNVVYAMAVRLPLLLAKSGAMIMLPNTATPSRITHMSEKRPPPRGRRCWGAFLGEFGPRRLSMDMGRRAPLGESRPVRFAHGTRMHWRAPQYVAPRAWCARTADLSRDQDTYPESCPQEIGRKRKAMASMLRMDWTNGVICATIARDV